MLKDFEFLLMYEMCKKAADPPAATPKGFFDELKTMSPEQISRFRQIDWQKFFENLRYLFVLYLLRNAYSAPNMPPRETSTRPDPGTPLIPGSVTAGLQNMLAPLFASSFSNLRNIV